MSEDVDEVRLAEWAALLSELLRSKEGVATVGAPSNIQPSPPPPLPPAPSQLPPPLEAKVDSAPEPPPAPPPPPVAPPLLSFSGSASSMLSALWASGVREDAAMAAALDCATFTPKPPPPQPVTAAAAEPTKVVPPPFPSSAAPWIPGSTRQKRPGGPSTLLKGQAVLHRPAHGRAHVDFISPDGELVCSAAVRRKASAPLAVASLRVNEDPWASAADRAAVTAAGVGVGATSAVGAETLTTAQSVAPEGSRARTASEEASCDCTRCEMQVFRAGTEVGKRRLESTSSLSTSPGQPLVVRHLNHHDSLIPTNEAGTEFKLHCGLLRRKKSSSSVTSSVFSDFVSEAQARGGPTRDGSARSSELTSSCSCCDGSGGGGGDGSSRGDGDDSDKFSKEHELFRLLDEDEVCRVRGQERGGGMEKTTQFDDRHSFAVFLKLYLKCISLHASPLLGESPDDG